MSAKNFQPEDEKTLFVEGYLSQRVSKGDLPDYGYNKNGLPPTSGKSREVKISYLAALAKRRAE